MSILNTNKDVRLVIYKYIQEKGISITNMAAKIGTSVQHLSCILRRERRLTEANLKKINDFLEKNFEMTEQPKPRVAEIE